ncbi:MAG: hypothetical protein H7Y13_11585 [Sphingobacteriaceae bacterium]|nr:hypothetical protein [Sphingobacteriaceae bacterium]
MKEKGDLLAFLETDQELNGELKALLSDKVCRISELYIDTLFGFQELQHAIDCNQLIPKRLFSKWVLNMKVFLKRLVGNK